MSAMTVLPPEPSESGVYWLRPPPWSPSEPEVWIWIAKEGWFAGDNSMTAGAAHVLGYRCLCRCPSPDEIAAADRAQRESDDTIAQMQQTITDLTATFDACATRLREAIVEREELRARVQELTTALDDKAANAIHHPETF